MTAQKKKVVPAKGPFKETRIDFYQRRVESRRKTRLIILFSLLVLLCVVLWIVLSR